MSYVEQWRALSARIDGITVAAGALQAQDAHGAWKFLGATCGETFVAIQQFVATFERTLPPEVVALVKAFADGNRAKVLEGAKTDGAQMKAAVVFLTLLQSEITYYLAGRQEVVRSLTERAFLHLQRVLAVDDRERELWLAAFTGTGETACERLGATRLLYHGIYAFKINAEGARTDLMVPEPVDPSIEARGVDGLVLTEWKVAADAAGAARQFETARTQAALYQRGALLGLELAAYRFLVVVTRAPVAAIPADTTQDGVIYRHINIAIEPPVPSVQARAGAET